MKYILSLMLVFSSLAMAQDDAASKPPPCSTDQYRQFDFWIGDWTVTSKNADGQDQLAGHNLIKPIHNQCALQENWTSAGATMVGSSFNIYDKANDKWHQTWVDSNGTLLELDGGFQDGSMVLSGQRPARDGSGMVTHRISWTPNADGSVRQLWEASKDGNSWKALFDGLYRKTEGPAPGE